jgi:hypothetical protein
MEWNAKAEGGQPFSEPDPASILGGIIALWLLSIVASHDSKCKIIIMEAGAIEVLTNQLSNLSLTACQV